MLGYMRPQVTEVYYFVWILLSSALCAEAGCAYFSQVRAVRLVGR